MGIGDLGHRFSLLSFILAGFGIVERRRLLDKMPLWANSSPSSVEKLSSSKFKVALISLLRRFWAEARCSESIDITMLLSPTAFIAVFFALLVFRAGEFADFEFGIRRGDGAILLGVGLTCEFGVKRINDFRFGTRRGDCPILVGVGLGRELGVKRIGDF